MTQRGQQGSAAVPLLPPPQPWLALGVVGVRQREAGLTRSPLLRRAVGLSLLAAADGDGVEVVEGTQGHPGDGHKLGAEANEDSLGVIKRVTEVMDDGDNQGIVPAAQDVDTCQRRDKIRGRVRLNTIASQSCGHFRGISPRGTAL